VNVTDFTILLVEDNPDDVHFVQRAFSKVSLVNPLKVVRDGREALDYLQGKDDYADRKRYPLPSLVLLDLKLPRKSGLEVLEWIRQQAAYKNLPVIVLTSSTESADLNRAYELGANSYLVKPVGFDGLLEMVKSIGMYWMILNRSARPAPEARPPGSPSRPAASAGPRLLLVDADEEFLSAAREGLWRQGCLLAAETAATGLEALDRLGRGGFEAVVIARGVADADGLRLLDGVRALNPSLPVFLLTEEDDPAFTALALDRGARKVLKKTFPLSRFLRTLREEIEAHPQAAPAPEKPALPAWVDPGGDARDTAVFGPNHAFQATSWALVRSAKNVEALDSIIRVYWKPLYFFVRQRGYDNETAKDIVQDFFKTLMERGALSKADPSRGRFRTFLLAALTNFLHDWARTAGRLKRGGGETPGPLADFGLEAGAQGTPDEAMDRAWAKSLLEQCVSELKGDPAHVEAFRLQMSGMDFKAISQKTGLSEGAARTAVHRLRGQFRELLVGYIAQTAASEDEIESELSDFLSLLR